MAFERGVVAVVISVTLSPVSLTVVVGVSVIGVGVTSGTKVIQDERLELWLWAQVDIINFNMDKPF